jgi:hypothetical protein
MDDRGEDEPPDTHLSRRLHHALADIDLIRKECRRNVEDAVHALERSANTGSVAKVAYGDLGRTVRAQIVSLLFVLYEAANRGTALGELRYHEACKLAGRTYRENRRSVAYHGFIPPPTKCTLAGGRLRKQARKLLSSSPNRKVFARAP